MNHTNLTRKAQNTEPINRKFFSRLKQKKPKNLDVIVKESHEKVFNNTNCLDCANCCKSISPILNKTDIERLAGSIRMKYSDFCNKYIQIDEDEDYVFNITPCPFLLPDNFCMVYNERPKACREYPHTDRKNFIKLLDLTLKNSFFCPAVFEIIELLKKRNEFKGIQ